MGIFRRPLLTRLWLLPPLGCGALALFEACGGNSGVDIGAVDAGGGPASSGGGTSGGTSSGGTSSGGTSSGGTSSGGTSSGGTSSGGTSSGGTDSGGITDGGGGDGGTDSGTTSPIGCPSDMPTSGTSCTGTKQCSYGTDPRFNCRAVAQCNDGGWAVDPGGCASPPVCPAAASPGGSCSNGEACGYATTTCTCYSCEIVCADPRPPPTFHCFPTASGCPPGPPNLGTACTGSAFCDYGGCTGGVRVQCTDGAWTRAFGVCPG